MIKKKDFDGLVGEAKRLFGSAYEENQAALEAVASNTAQNIPRFKGETFLNWWKRGILDALDEWSNS